MGAPVRVLVVDAGFAVGAAIERRLSGVAVVERTDGRDLVSGERDGSAFDLVVLCPYVPTRLRAPVVAHICSTRPAPSLVVIDDVAAGPRVELVSDAGAPSPAVAAVLDRLGAGAALRGSGLGQPTKKHGVNVD
jgi:hypothetical protein